MRAEGLPQSHNFVVTDSRLMVTSSADSVDDVKFSAGQVSILCATYFYHS